MFSTILSSFSNLFGSSRAIRESKPVTRRVALAVESLEGRALLSTLSASMVEAYATQNVQNAIADVKVAQYFCQHNQLQNTSAALQAAEQQLYQAAQDVVWGYYNANIPLANAQKALNTIDSLYSGVAGWENEVASALSASQNYLYGQGGAGSNLNALVQNDAASMANTIGGYDSGQLFSYGSDVTTYAGDTGAGSDGSGS